ncbi:MAG: hypothetical protein H8E47_08640 [Anaerolineales bacterium]|nr:hypothetical protein [Anaerolineales bacterium]
MSKVDSTRIADLKAAFELGDTLSEQKFADLITAIAEAAQEHEHVSGGGAGSGTGDAASIVNVRHGAPSNLPGSPNAGDLYIDTQLNRLFVAFTAGFWTQVLTGEDEMFYTITPEQIISLPSTENVDWTDEIMPEAIPEGATAVLVTLSVTAKDTDHNAIFSIRKKGQVSGLYIIVSAYFTNLTGRLMAICGIDEDRTMQYRVANQEVGETCAVTANLFGYFK